MKKVIIYILVFIIGFIAGAMFTIKSQKIDTIILQNGEGSTTVAIDFMGQVWNYTTKSGLESIND